MSAETALAVVDLLLDRDESARAKPELAGWAIDRGLASRRARNSGGYDPNILTTFLRGQWSAGDYYVVTRDGRRLCLRSMRPLPVALLVNSGHGERGRGARAEVPRARDRPDRGGDDGGDALGRRGGRPALGRLDALHLAPRDPGSRRKALRGPRRRAGRRGRPTGRRRCRGRKTRSSRPGSGRSRARASK